MYVICYTPNGKADYYDNGLMFVCPTGFDTLNEAIEYVRTSFAKYIIETLNGVTEHCELREDNMTASKDDKALLYYEHTMKYTNGIETWFFGITNVSKK